MKRGLWSTRIGFYLAAIGSAFGLGNLWRFPYVAAENGGGAFVLMFLFLVFIIGMPLLVGELMLGKLSRRSLVESLRRLSDDGDRLVDEGRGSSWLGIGLKLYPLAGWIAVSVCLLVLAYFAVISGWVLHFLMQFIVSFVRQGEIDPAMALMTLQQKGWLQIMLTSVHMIVLYIIVTKDVEEGIERWVGYMMPAFVILLLVLVVNSLSLQTGDEAIRFLFYPDFSKLKISSLAYALGHVLFTLSLGFGTMVTFGSYLQDRAYVPLAGFRVGMVDALISLFAGLLIFPLVIGAGVEQSGPDLLFRTVPFLLAHVPGGELFGIGFFLCLYLSALGASIGLLETVVSNVKEKTKMSRNRSTSWTAAICFILSLVPALSSSALSGVQVGGRGLLEIVDVVLINWTLPVVALFLSQAIAYRLNRALVYKEFEAEETFSSVRLTRHWIFVLKYVVPLVVIVALVLQAIDLLF